MVSEIFNGVKYQNETHEVLFYQNIHEYLPCGEMYSSAKNAFKENAVVYSLLNFDTEYDPIVEQLLKAGAVSPDAPKRVLVSKQYSSFANCEGGIIYSNEERHRNYHEIGEWGELVGASLELNPNKEKYTNTVVFVVFSHFQTAEAAYFFNNEAGDNWRIKYLADPSKVSCTKRIQVGSLTNKNGESVPMPFVRVSEYRLKFPDGTIANIAFKFVDTVGLHGNESYKGLLANTGLSTSNKELDMLCAHELLSQGLTTAELLKAMEETKMSDDSKQIISKEVEKILGYKPIENMGNLIKECPSSFDTYSLNDLKVSKILQKNDQLFRVVENSLGIPPEWHRVPKLTIGSQIARLLLQVFCVRLSVDWQMSEVKFFDKEKSKIKLEGMQESIDKALEKARLAKSIKSKLGHEKRAEKWQEKYDEESKKLEDWEAIEDSFYDMKYVEKLVKGSNPQAFVDRGDTASMLGKTFGGRCHNNLPTLFQVIGKVIVDADMSGCYGEGQRNQDKAFGRPEIVGFPVTDEEHNDYPTLKEWLKIYEKELVPGLWHAIIDTKGYELKHPQDFFPSWYIPSKNHDYMPYIKAMKKSLDDGDNIDWEMDANTYLSDGHVKIYEREIRNGVITSDGLDWLLNVPTTAQRNDILKNAKVICWVVYPKSTEVKNIDEYREKVKDGGKRTFKRFKKGKVATRAIFDESPTYWFRENLGELLIDDLLCHRKQFPKKPRHPLNNLFKLNVNTTYGVFASSFFNVSDSVVGNNITARARAYAWYFEKACRAFGVITDGGILDLNEVVFPISDRGRINGFNMVNSQIVEQKTSKWKDLKLAPIFTSKDDSGKIIEHQKVKYHSKQGNTHYYSLGKDEVITEKELITRLDVGRVIQEEIRDKNGSIVKEEVREGSVILEHMQRCFPFPDIEVLFKKRTILKPVFKKDDKGEDILENGVKTLADGNYKEFKPGESCFEWEMKGIFTDVKYHGASNYSLSHSKKPGKPKISMRSYNERKHWDSNGNLAKQSPARDFLNNLGENIKPTKPYVKTEILKLGEYQNNYEKFMDHQIAPGDSVIKTVHICPISLSQFKFLTIAQALAWDKAKSKEKAKTGWFIEMLYTFEDENGEIFIRYGDMVRDVFKAIQSGVMNPMEYFDMKRHRTRLKYYKNPHHQNKMEMWEMTRISKEEDVIEEF